MRHLGTIRPQAVVLLDSASLVDNRSYRRRRPRPQVPLTSNRWRLPPRNVGAVSLRRRFLDRGRPGFGGLELAHTTESRRRCGRSEEAGFRQDHAGVLAAESRDGVAVAWKCRGGARSESTYLLNGVEPLLIPGAVGLLRNVDLAGKLLGRVDGTYGLLDVEGGRALWRRSSGGETDPVRVGSSGVAAEAAGGQGR